MTVAVVAVADVAVASVTVSVVAMVIVAVVVLVACAAVAAFFDPKAVREPLFGRASGKRFSILTALREKSLFDKGVPEALACAAVAPFFGESH